MVSNREHLQMLHW